MPARHAETARVFASRRPWPRRNCGPANKYVGAFGPARRLRYHQSLEGVVDELHFEGDPAIDSTRRRLERVMKEGEPRSEWKWMAALAAGAGALIFWQVRRRRRNGEDRGEKRIPA